VTFWEVEEMGTIKRALVKTRRKSIKGRERRKMLRKAKINLHPREPGRNWGRVQPFRIKRVTLKRIKPSQVVSLLKL